MKIKTGDAVKIITGKDRGRETKVLRTYPKQDKVLLDQANMYKKHMKKSEQFPQGGVVEIPRPIHVSNVMKVKTSKSKASGSKTKL